MKLAVIMAMALATLAVIDSATAAARQRAQVGSKSVAGGSLTSKTIRPKTSQPTSKGIIMRDGGVCDPIRHMGC
jgi:hypothetical protein